MILYCNCMIVVYILM